MSANQITSNFVQAAGRLGFSFEPAFSVAMKDGSVIQSLGFVRHFGSELGTLIFSESECPSTRECEELQGMGYFYSLLFGCFYELDEQLFKDTLNDWGFFGNEQERPDWYSGAPA
ncbi:MAG TPA: hypothetical protein VF179_08945 [Thermoanaerobaculia bacterium]|nr:hypothetical protein [Thermoanaerobaculia bacterium]